jgi:polysaccharide biosynthesis protein PslG
MLSPDFGAQAFLWWRPEVAERDLKLMQEGGFNWVKQAFAWETIEGEGKGQFDWSIADRVVRSVNNDGLKLLARLSSDPELNTFWAGHPPGNADNFADFAFALASRYNCQPGAQGCIQAYQVWNEPNLAREWGGNPPNPAQYGEFLRKAYAAIKRGNPNAIVISAGMAPTGDNNNVAMPDDVFYDQMYQAMGGNSTGYFDMLGVHGAGFAAPPELDPAEAASNPKYGGYRFFAFRHVEDIRAIMVRYGDTNKKIVLLEFGWTFDPVNPAYRWHGADAGIDQFVQGNYLRGAYQYAAQNWSSWIGLMNLLTMPNQDWMNDGNPQDEEQYWWAIMEPSNVNELNFRAAYIILCDYFNRQRGQTCPHDPALKQQ